MIVRPKTKLIRLGRARVLTRTSGLGHVPELDNPIERYM